MPNTYTFTKSMAERTLRKKRRPDMPMVIFKPSIIIGGYNEPLNGWTDTLSAAGALSVACGAGIINYVPGHNDIISDLVPVDFVSNTIIVCTAIEACKPKLAIVHCGTSHQNPVTWGYFMTTGVKYVNR